jgi:hypothetical protein
MSAAPRRRARIIRALATLMLSASSVLVATDPLAHAVQSPGQATKTCVRINGCSASASSPPLALTGGQPATSSHLNVAVATAPKSATAARHASGTLMTNAAGARAIRCGGYRFRSPTTFQFQLRATGPASVRPTRRTGFFKLYITYEITDRITNTTADGVQFCLGADFGFKTLSGRPAPARRLPDGKRGHIGLLPPCPQPLPPPGRTKAPCVEPVTTVADQGSSTGVDVILKARVPTLVGEAAVLAGDSGAGDPWGAG